MKTYKTWELLKMAEETSKNELKERKFKNDGNVIVTFGINAFGRRGLAIDNSCVMYKNILANEEWTEVQQPVSFMEAAKAFIDGKNIRCECQGMDSGKFFTEKFHHSCFDSRDMAADSPDITFYTALNGKWFIEGE